MVEYLIRYTIYRGEEGFYPGNTIGIWDHDPPTETDITNTMEELKKYKSDHVTIDFMMKLSCDQEEE